MLADNEIVFNDDSQIVAGKHKFLVTLGGLPVLCDDCTYRIKPESQYDIS